MFLGQCILREVENAVPSYGDSDRNEPSDAA
jgi:hypothetical protein